MAGSSALLVPRFWDPGAAITGSSTVPVTTSHMSERNREGEMNVLFNYHLV